MSKRLFPWAALISLLIAAAIGFIQFRYSVIRGTGGGVLLWDRWSSRVCLAAYGVDGPACPDAKTAKANTDADAKIEESVMRLRKGGFSEKEIQEWVAEQHRAK